MKKNKIKNTFKKAFTLVELIIVIAVIAILAIFLIPNFSNVLNDANATNVKSDLANMKNIVAAYIAEVGAVPVANTNTGTDTLININGSYSGVSTAGFQKEADGKEQLYAIDMDLLTKSQTNVDDKVSVISPKLSSIPATSALTNVTEKTGDTAPASKLKNTSVVYVIDENLAVSAVFSDELNTKTKTQTAFNGLKFKFVGDGIPDCITVPDGAVTEQSKIFKLPVTDIGSCVKSGITVDDSRYN